MAEPARSVDAAHLDELIGQFASAQWIDRKRAAEQLVHLATQLPGTGSEFASLARRLVQGVVEPSTVDARATCHETLARLGRGALPFVLERFDQRSGAGRRALVDLIGTLGGADEVLLLGGLLQDAAEDANVRAAAATGLGEIGGDAAQRCLVAMLREAGEVLRLFVLDGLRQSRARLALATIEPYLEDPLTCRCGVALLGSSRDPAALGVLGGLCVHRSAGVRAEAVKAAAALWADLAGEESDGDATARLALPASAWSGVYELFDDRDAAVSRAAITLAVRARDVGALSRLMPLVADPWVAERAVVLVSRLGCVASEPLERALAAGDLATTGAALTLIGGMRRSCVDPGLAQGVIRYLEHEDPTIAAAAIEAVRRLELHEAIGSLFRRCADDGALGEQAASAIVDVAREAPQAARRELDELLHRAWPQEGPRASHLCRIVCQLDLRDHLPDLLALARSRDVAVRLAAVQGLGLLGGAHEGISVLTLALADEDMQVRAAACRSLGALGAQEACEPLLSATLDHHASVRAAAVQALVLFDNVVARNRYREIALEDPSPTVIVYAVAGLARSGREEDLSLLMSLCSATDVEVTKAAARALAYHTPHRATAALIGLFGHDRWDVRRAAALALARRGDRTALEPLRRVSQAEPDALVQQALSEAIASLEKARASA
ncbi:MAG: hypothetical protein B7733_18460 [Myxococcales bacterium FL481]|nr:MAG: hypothetical protein B7733_18460 [Myxococcales bacterium FL481]